MAAENTTTTSPHILVFPYPAQGHMLPLLDFTHQLASPQNHLTITILVTPKNLPLLTPLLSSHPSIQTLVLPFPNCPLIPSGIENVKDLPAAYFLPMIYAMAGLKDPILQWFKSHPAPPTVILSDFFLGWTYHLACQLGIRRVVFSPSGAFNLCNTSELWRNLPQRDDSYEMFSFTNMPNSPSYPWWQLSSLYRSYVQGEPISEFLRDASLANLVSWGFVFNSFSELESVYLDHMKKLMGHDRVWGVGPLIAHNIDAFGPMQRSGATEKSGNEILSWIDTCEDRSVVYVCFGSQAVLTNAQMEKVAEGLEQSGARFIWVNKEPTIKHVSNEYGWIPDGFEHRVVGRGIVFKGWAPQVLILRHRAVGAFLTHCGWNSVLESLVSGVPMLAWPMGADQFSNAKLLVDQMGVAVRVCEGSGTIPNVTELARVVGESVSENGFEMERLRAVKLSKEALGAVKEGGSSFEDLNEFVKAVCNIP